MVEILKSRYSTSGQDGDFGWMIEQPQFSRTLFVFNDNEEEFYSHRKGGPHVCSSGGGNAIIRPYQCGENPTATGVPTGSYTSGPHYGGYSSLDDQVIRAISDSMNQIETLLQSGRFDRLAFSWDPQTNLGGRIFSTAQIVRDFIVAELFAVVSRH